MKAQGFILFLVLAVAAGCSGSRSARKLPVAIPSEWAAKGTNGAVNADRWWESFGDAQLALVVDEALRANHDLRKAAARVEAARGQAKIAGADLLPSAGFSFDSQRRQQNFVGLPIPGAQDRVLTSRSTTHTALLTASWELDLWGRIRSGRRAAIRELEASEREYRAAQLSLAAQTARAWMAAAEAKKQLELARATATSYGTTVRQVRQRYERGIRSPLDLRLALGSEASAQALVAQRENQYQAAARVVEILLGRYPAGNIKTAEALPEVPAAVPAGLPSELLERRADVVAAERRMEASRARVSEAKAALFPRISLTASGGRSSSEVADLLSSQFNIWTLAGNFAQPIFEGGKLRAGVKLAQAQSKQSVEEYASAVLRAFQEVETALAAEQHLERWERELAESVEQTAAATRLAEERYRNGLEEFVTLLESQRRALEAESQLLGVRRQRLENRIDLHLALGGGFGESGTWGGGAEAK